MWHRIQFSTQYPKCVCVWHVLRYTLNNRSKCYLSHLDSQGTRLWTILWRGLRLNGCVKPRPRPRNWTSGRCRGRSQPKPRAGRAAAAVMPAALPGSLIGRLHRQEVAAVRMCSPGANPRGRGKFALACPLFQDCAELRTTPRGPLASAALPMSPGMVSSLEWTVDHHLNGLDPKFVDGLFEKMCSWRVAYDPCSAAKVWPCSCCWMLPTLALAAMCLKRRAAARKIFEKPTAD